MAIAGVDIRNLKAQQKSGITTQFQGHWPLSMKTQAQHFGDKLPAIDQNKQQNFERCGDHHGRHHHHAQ